MVANQMVPSNRWEKLKASNIKNNAATIIAVLEY